MTQIPSSNQLLDPAILGSWIFQRSHIWQMDFLTANKLAEFATKRGLPHYREEHINHLWKLRLLRADLIVSVEELGEPGLIFLGKDEDAFLYADGRLPQVLQDIPDLPLEEAQALSSGLKVFFHPFRFAVLQCISQLVPGTSAMQMVYPQMYQTQKMTGIWLQMIQSGQKSFYGTPYWNDVVSLLVATEPCFYERIFEHLHIRLSQTHPIARQWSQEGESDPLIEASSKALRTEMAEHRNDVFDHYRTLDPNRLKQLHQTLYVQARMLDSNTNVHRILRLGNEHLRLNLEGDLGGAMLFRDMAEFLRRAIEEIFIIQLKEEDEWYEEAKETLFGSKRLFDGDRNVGNQLLRHHGLSYGPRLRWYVEGDTEFGGLSDLFRDFGATDIEILNLRGQIVQKNNIAFRESLRSDIRMGIFSFVSLDKDVPRNLQVVKAAARQDQICGSFFVSNPDFEFGNFTLSELQEIVWDIALESGAETSKKTILLDVTKDAKSGREFTEGIKRTASQVHELWTITKGEVWGKRLIQYALEHPIKQNGGERLCVKAIRQAFHSRSASYNYTRLHYGVDAETGQPIKRDTPMTTQERLKEI